MDARPFRIDTSVTEAFPSFEREWRDGADGSSDAFERPYSAVVIGGGTGSPVSIRTLLSLGVETSAVVAMADDGGSTGMLRDKANVSPPGDVRKCLVAFADNPYDPLVRAFKYRIAAASNHALGNLMLAALEDASGSFPNAISICEHLLHAQGHVYPSTLGRPVLNAVTQDGIVLEGQALACHSTTALSKVELEGEDGTLAPYPPALDAIRRADLIVLGPGSLFTSIIATLLVPGIVDAIRESRAKVLFVCSLADVQGETWGLSSKEHVQALYNHGMEGLIDYVLLHSPYPIKSAPLADESFQVASGDETGATRGDEVVDGGIRRVRVSYNDVQEIRASGPVVLARDLADKDHPAWHSPAALRDAILQVMSYTDSNQEDCK